METKFINKKGNIVMPNGWTYLRHGTNHQHGWNENLLTHNFIVNHNGLSCVKRVDAIREAYFGRNTASSYGGNDLIEIRVLIYDELIRQHTENYSFICDNVPPKIRKYISNYYYFNRYHIGAAGGRHELVPSGEELIFIGRNDYDEISKKEHPIYYFVPSFLFSYYLKDCNFSEDKINEIITQKIELLYKIKSKFEHDLFELNNPDTRQKIYEYNNLKRKIEKIDWEIKIHENVLKLIMLSHFTEEKYLSDDDIDNAYIRYILTPHMDEPINTKII